MIEVRNLGLAAYVKMHGGRLVEVRNRVFLFESERTVEDWELAYANSCCARHDQEVMTLRRMMG